MKSFFRYIVLWHLLFLNISSYCQVFSEVQKIVADDRQFAKLGNAVAISGDYAVISAYQMNSKNSVYVYQKIMSGQWIQIQKIVSPENRPYDGFGYSVDIFEEKIIIGDWAFFKTNPVTPVGAAYIYKKDNNNVWQLHQKLQASDGKVNDIFGYSVSIFNNSCIIGETQNNGYTGATYLFEEDSTGNWVEINKLEASDKTTWSLFGSNISIFDSIVAVGAPGESRDENGNNYISNSGSVYIFEKNSGGLWGEVQKLVAPDRVIDGIFGSSIAIEENRIIIGAGSINNLIDNRYFQSCGAYIYEKNASGFWDFIQKLSPPDPSDHLGFGNSLGLSGNYAVVSAVDERKDNNENVLGLFTGAVYIFKRQSNGIWENIQRIVSSDLATEDYFGRSVAIEGYTAIVGATHEDEDENGQNTIDRAGSAYVFETCPPSLDTIYHTTCETHTWQGQTYMSSGSYNYETTASSGCDSIITLQLTILPTSTSESVIETCTSYTWNGTTYTQSGTYTYQTISTNGCDSIATLDLTVHHRTESATVMASCDHYDWNGQTYTQSGMYTFQTQNIHGCDSLASLFLTISPSYLDTSFVTTCDAYTWSGNTYNQSGTYTWSEQTTSGCDSILTLVLNLQNTIETEENITACDSYVWNGNTFTSSGMYTHQTISSLGCDSIVTLYLEVFPTVIIEENLTACDTLLWNGQTYDESGIYSHQSQTFTGCDSITQLYLTILSSSNTNLFVEACGSYTWNGQTYQSSGSYTFQSSNHLGCDSTVVIDLTIHNESSSSTEISACDQYNWNGNSYSQSGTYDFSSLNHFGCDSTAVLELTVHPSYEVLLSLSDCVSVDYFGNSYTESGYYPISLQSQFGCDSIVRLDVHILSESYDEVQISCDSFYWPVSDQYFDQSGIYQQTFTNIDGCDSTFSLTLEINPSYKETENITTCDTYRWSVNQNNYSESGLYEFRSQTHKGCDSLRYLQLNIEKSFEQRDTVRSERGYVWLVDQNLYEKSGQYEARYSTTNGCDSVYFLLLSINKLVLIEFPNIISLQGFQRIFRGYSSESNVFLKKLSIFDRMASRVYHLENTNINDENYGWDGTLKGVPVMPGVYVWIAEIVLPDGTIEQMAGDVTVIR